jgi:hypothetical protein
MAQCQFDAYCWSTYPLNPAPAFTNTGVVGQCEEV